LPFAFHSINGVRHLMWDTGIGIISFIWLMLALSNKQVIRTGWTVVGLSSVTALWLAML
jgi:succinate dehydrogenase (ubiquinone) cytochrome b560 subunit